MKTEKPSNNAYLIFRQTRVKDVPILSPQTPLFSICSTWVQAGDQSITFALHRAGDKTILVCKGFGAWLADIFVQGQRVNILGFAGLTTNQILGSSMKESETTGKQVVQLYSNQTIS